MNFLDDLLPVTFHDVASLSSMGFVAIAAIAIASPYILIVAAVFVAACVFLRTFYIRAALQVRTRYCLVALLLLLLLGLFE